MKIRVKKKSETGKSNQGNRQVALFMYSLTKFSLVKSTNNDTASRFVFWYMIDFMHQWKLEFEYRNHIFSQNTCRKSAFVMNSIHLYNTCGRSREFVINCCFYYTNVRIWKGLKTHFNIFLKMKTYRIPKNYRFFFL